ncbi:hypothetical protein DFR52_102812 [Hoeflea marina]|uniref:Uncharacterized protein n=1 Tax=Hoeflea marina TaxID=274592 RepID=A0A317PTJ4_9HYPH|nr:hypothetical protein [Hoeflea marina]PWW02144.1 hypothetical protein DFR52_102812 [Hoeflea marina]
MLAVVAGDATGRFPGEYRLQTGLDAHAVRVNAPFCSFVPRRAGGTSDTAARAGLQSHPVILKVIDLPTTAPLQGLAR